jgi:hypothetical protein
VAAAIDAHVSIQAYANYVANQIDELLIAADQQLNIQLQTALLSHPVESYTVQRLTQLVQSVANVEQFYTPAYNQLLSDLKGEADVVVWADDLLLSSAADEYGAVFNTITPQAVYTAATTMPFDGAPLSEWWERLEQSQQNRINDTVRSGWLSGDSAQEIAAALIEDGVLSTGDGASDTTARRQAKTIARTGVSILANTSHKQIIQANADWLDGQEWIATLDTRTCLICAANDHEIYDADADITCPAHFGCRCVLVAITPNMLALRQKLDLTRASMNGQVSASWNYGDWLRTRSQERIEQILGPQRAALFLSGKADIKNFVDNGRVLTLEELKAELS